MGKNDKKNANASPKAKSQHSRYSEDAATAPYNFIFQPESTKSYCEETITDTYSGDIVCSLENLTPMLVAGASNRDDKKDPNKFFFKVEDDYVIPGTSLKGLLRTVVETISFSKIDPVSSSPIFWRNIIGKTKTGEQNSNTATLYKDEFDDDIHGGFIQKVGSRYYFYECKVTRDSSKDHPSKPITAHSADEESFSNKDYLYTGPMVSNTEGKNNGKTIRRAYKFTPLNEAPILLDKEVISNFKKQLEPCKDQQSVWKYDYEKFLHGEKARVFYNKKVNGKIDKIGTARYFRIPHSKVPSDLVGVVDCSKDFSKQLFGYISKSEKGIFAKKGKVRVSSCYLNNCKEEVPVKVVLGAPKPSCVQHYLFQEKNRSVIEEKKKKGNVSIDDFFLYSKGSQIRGRKFYWHRDNDVDGYYGDDSVKDSESILHPIKAGATGDFKVSFIGVSEYELGAVLEALSFDDYGGAYKLGMGKPYGFGSVKIKIKALNVCKDSDRYQTLMNRLETPDSCITEEQLKKQVEIFVSSFKDKIKDKVLAKQDFDSNQSIEQLRIISNYHERPNNEDTAYMPLSDRDRPGCSSSYSQNKILPLINDVRNPKTKRK